MFVLSDASMIVDVVVELAGVMIVQNVSAVHMGTEMIVYDVGVA